MHIERQLILGFFLCFFGMGIAQNSSVAYNSADSLVFESYKLEMAKYSAEPIGDLMVRTAKFFLEKPYVASTLENSKGENLVINLREFDCTTFVENCMALSLTIKSDEVTFNNYSSILQNIRYRGGVVDGYSSRLHYVTDWINDNKREGLFEDMTLELGGKRIDKTINFMSVHPHLYPLLKGNVAEIEKIKKVENELNNLKSYAIVPKSVISTLDKSIDNGDIVIFATTIAGLDYTHIGISYRERGVLTFIHASTRMNKVIIESQSLNNYCSKSKRCNGISVLRLNSR